jgi:hypothetical protein
LTKGLTEAILVAKLNKGANMITAQMLSYITQFSAPALTRAINLAGYKEDKFTSAKFLGITNGGQFCYMVTYKTDERETDSCKVFLTYDQAAGTVSADY